jgi:putative ABC transport system permease protein
VTMAALLPALRAGLLKPAVVIANATGPRGSSGRWLRRLASLAGLPRPVVIGLGEAAARPMRAILTLVAIFVGVATVVVALGVTRSFAGIYSYEGHAGKVDVVVNRSPALADADAMQLIGSRPETARVVAQASANLTVPGIGDPVLTLIFRGDSASLGYVTVAGRWINGPGEVVAPRGLLQDAHLKIGDTFTATFRGVSVPLRVVGEVYDFVGGPGGHELIVDWSTIASAVPSTSPFTYLVTLKPGSDVAAYMNRIAAAQPDLLDAQASSTSVGALTTINAVLFAIAVVLALIAVAGIFNTLLLNTRERVRDTATLKALGMSPRQVIGMVASSAGLLALVGGVAAVPAGIELSRLLFDLVGRIGGDRIPSAEYGAFAPWELVAIPLAGLVVAVAAAMIPGRWAARTNVVEALHAE